jgi:hypothetical protein
MVMGVKAGGQQRDGGAHPFPPALANVVQELGNIGGLHTGEGAKALFHTKEVFLDGLVY